jgi:hypothetical protein
VVCTKSNNWYDLLWCILALTIPGFDPSIPVQFPTCHDDNIFNFATSLTLNYQLHAKWGVYHDDRTCSITFLQAITEPAYANAVTSLLTCVSNYYVWEDKGYLPLHLCIMGLTLQLCKSAITRVVIVLPKVRHTASNVTAPDTFIQGSPCGVHANGTNQWNDKFTNRGPTRTSDRSTDCTDHEHCSNILSHPPTRSFVQSERGNRNGRPPSAWASYAQPDRNTFADAPATSRPTVMCLQLLYLLRSTSVTWTPIPKTKWNPTGSNAGMGLWVLVQNLHVAS